MDEEIAVDHLCDVYTSGERSGRKLAVSHFIAGICLHEAVGESVAACRFVGPFDHYLLLLTVGKHCLNPAVLARALTAMLYLAYEAAIGDAEEHEARVVAHDAHLVDYRGVAHHSHHIGVFAQKGCGGGVERRVLHIGYINIHEGGAVDTSGKIYHRHIAGVPSALAATRCHQCSQSHSCRCHCQFIHIA